MAAARALAPGITVLPRISTREAFALEALACWAGRYTPRLHLASPDALLLEIGGCLRLWGSLEILAQAVADGAYQQGYRNRLAVAPTPQGALWLAQAGQGPLLCPDKESLAAALAALPLDLLPAKAAQLMGRFGIRNLGDLRRLPATELSRRIGPDTLVAVARAYGELPDLRPDFVFPLRFEQHLELPGPVESAPALAFAARRLLASLAGWLAARQAGVCQCSLQLGHRRGVSTLVLGFADPTRNEARLERVMRERLARLNLSAPVERLGLSVNRVEDLPGASIDIFTDQPGRESGTTAMATLLESLRARLGDEQVFGIVPLADHRPERATRRQAVGAVGSGATNPRPLWLLARPEPLREVAGRPQRYGAPLRLLAGPERIESGWWDGEEAGPAAGGDIRRDYFIALTADQRWAWIYRDCKSPGGWLLHGWFG